MRYVIAGFVAHTKDWANFSKEWQNLLPTHGVLTSGPTPQYHFKMSEMMASEERAARIPAFERVIYENIVAEFAWSMTIADVDLVQRRFLVNNTSPRIRPALTPFYFLFFGMIEHLAIFLSEPRQKVITGKLELIFDEQFEARQILRIWEDYIRTNPLARDRFPFEPRFANDKELLPLQAADYLAWQVRDTFDKGRRFGFWAKRFRNPELPSLHVVLENEHVSSQYYTLLRSTFPNAVISDAMGVLSPGELEELYFGSWNVRVNHRRSTDD